MGDPLKELAALYVAPFERELERYCSSRPERVPEKLFDAMTYSLRAGGKRLRPALCMASADACGADPTDAIPMALALEFVHTASLIHDDMPCMDDDELRRGSPTNHVVFGEAVALLAGNSLMLGAFEILLTELPRRGVDPSRVVEASRILASCAGASGMHGGQVLDTDPDSREVGDGFPKKVSSLKTAAMIRASVLGGAAVAGVVGHAAARWDEYGEHLGIAFQIVDDILDVTSTREELGKTPHKDEEQDKRTFVTVFGLDRAREMASAESRAAADAYLAMRPEGGLLADVALSLAERRH